MLLLKPWEPLVATTSIQFFEHELLREIAALKYEEVLRNEYRDLAGSKRIVSTQP